MIKFLKLIFMSVDYIKDLISNVFYGLLLVVLLFAIKCIIDIIRFHKDKEKIKKLKKQLITMIITECCFLIGYVFIFYGISSYYNRLYILR